MNKRDCRGRFISDVVDTYNRQLTDYESSLIEEFIKKRKEVDNGIPKS